MNKAVSNPPSEAMASHSSMDEMIDLREYWRTLMMHKWGIMGFSFLMTLLAVLVVLNITPIYRATATLLIEAQKTNVVSIEEVYGLDGGNSEYLLTQFEILKSRKLAETVVNKFDLAKHPDYNQPSQFAFIEEWDLKGLAEQHIPFELPLTEPPALTVEQLREIKFQQTVDAFLKNLSVSPIRKTQLVKISYESSDPQTAAKIANAVADAYIESTLAAKLELTVKATSWLNEQLKDQRAELTAAEKRLQEYREKEQIVGENGGIDIATRELDLISEKLVDARRERLEKESIYRQIRQAGRNNPDALQLITPILVHPLVQTMKESVSLLQIKRSELSKRYGSRHPRMVAVDSELARAQQDLDRQIISVARGLENEYKVASSAEASLKSNIKGTKGDIQNLSRKEYRLKELQQDVDTKRALYDQFYTRFSETTVTGDLKTANARVSDPAIAPQKPIKPKKKLIVAAVVFLSALFAAMVSLIAKVLDNTLQSSSEVEQKLSQTMLGLLPKLKSARKKKNHSYHYFIEEPRSPYAEALRTIRTGIVLSSLDNPYKIICVTSTNPGEGKTTTSLGLACAFGQMERVLLIDADMRKPSLAKAVTLNPRDPGLSNLAAASHSFEDCIYRFEAGNIDVLPSGVIPPNPSELLASRHFGLLLEELAKQYDRIIIDTAPCQAVSDAMVLAPVVDAYIYVAKADATPVKHIKSGLKRLQMSNATIAGIVLNQVDVVKGAKYYGEDYAGYYNAYGYS